jgi:hypothetical protein
MTQTETADTEQKGRTGTRSSSPFLAAEQFTAEWSEKVADWVARTVARTREEIEDIWAEAQSIRRGE